MVANIPIELIIFTMCALTGTDPFYNCDETWVIYWYPQEKDMFKYCYPGVKSFHWVVPGCAEFDDNRGYMIIVGSAINERTQTGETTFKHELHHLQCRCDHHERK